MSPYIGLIVKIGIIIVQFIMGKEWTLQSPMVFPYGCNSDDPSSLEFQILSQDALLYKR